MRWAARLKTWIGPPDNKKAVLRGKRTGGTTLVELLLATVFLGLCVGGMLSSISGARERADIAKYDLLSLALAESEISNIRSEAMRNVLTTGKNTSTVSVSGMPMQVTVEREVTLVSGTTDIYQAVVTVSYQRSVSTRTVTDGAKLSTMVRMPDV